MALSLREKILLVASFWTSCHGHGHMTLPPSRNGGTMSKAADCLQGECMWFSQPDADPRVADRIGRIPGEPTLNDASFRTFNVHVSSGPMDYTRTSPWRAPGSAPVLGSGCGRAGGGPVREMDGGTAKEFGLTQNLDGSDLPRTEPATIWKRGSVQEVAWANNANHGGGYAYRLCRHDALAANVTESCFQSGHLDFVGDTQWLQTWNDNHSNWSRIAIPRVTVSNGTFPEGSQWARTPIPACRKTGAQAGWPNCKADDCASCCADPQKARLPTHPRINESWWREMDCIAECAANGATSCDGVIQFPEPTPGMSGLWSTWRWCGRPNQTHGAARRLHGVGDSPGTVCSRTPMLATNIIDHVRVPDTLEPGHYLLSWRWDSEQTNQVWQNCADVEIVDDTTIV